MGIEINYGKSAVALPAASLTARLGEASEHDLKILLLLAAEERLRAEYPESAAAIAERVGCSEKDVELSVSFWRGAGIFSISKDGRRRGSAEHKPAPAKPDGTRKAIAADSVPEYSGEKIEKLMSSDGGSLAALIDECQNIVGKIFNPLEINKIVALSDYLKLENEYVMLLCEYCRSKGKSSVHYIEKTAYSLYNDGIDDVLKLEEYIKHEEGLREFSGVLRTMFGIGERSLTAKEKNCFALWQSRGTDTELIRRAYEITVEKTGKYSIGYLGKIMDNWYEKGITDAAAAEKEEESFRRTKEGFDISSFDNDEAFAAAVRRGYGE